MLKWLEYIGIAIIAVLAPIQAVMITVGVLVVGDFLTGIAAALKSKDQITSARLRDTVSKFVVYQIAIISGFLVEAYIMNHSMPVSKIVAGAIGLAELKSILENMNIVTGRNLFDDIIKKIGSTNSNT